MAGVPDVEQGGGDQALPGAEQGSPAQQATPPSPPTAPERAAVAVPAEELAQTQALAEPRLTVATLRQADRPQTAPPAGHPSTGQQEAPAASPAAEAATLVRHTLAEASARAATEAIPAMEATSADAGAATAADGPLSDAERQGGGEGGQGRKRPPSVQEAATEAALQKIGQASWDILCEQLRQRAQQAEQGQEADGRGGRGRGRKGGRKAGRKGGRGGTTAQQAIRLTDVLNPNSAVYHAEFAAAYHVAKDELAKCAARALLGGSLLCWPAALGVARRTRDCAGLACLLCPH